MMFRRYLYFTDLNSIEFNVNQIFIDYHFFPNYLLKWIEKGNYNDNKAILIDELIIWKKYLNNLEYLNDLSWIKCLRILIDNQFNFSEKFKKQILNSSIKIENEVNNFMQEQKNINCSLVTNSIIKQNYHFIWKQVYQRNTGLKQIKYILKILSFHLEGKILKQNYLLEENLDLNIFQLDYLKFLFTIVDE